MLRSAAILTVVSGATGSAACTKYNLEQAAFRDELSRWKYAAMLTTACEATQTEHAHSRELVVAFVLIHPALCCQPSHSILQR